MNMSYCRFYNTYEDLIECKNALADKDICSESEKVYAKLLLKACKSIIEEYNDEYIDKIIDEDEE